MLMVVMQKFHDEDILSTKIINDNNMIIQYIVYIYSNKTNKSIIRVCSL